MQTFIQAITFFIVVYQLSFTRCSESFDYCPTQVCSYNEPLTRYVRFPFLIRNESLPRSCGYPGFDLLCDTTDRLLIDIHNSGVFAVQVIDYGRQQLWLNDPNNCLPKKLLALDHSISSYSPFKPVLERVHWLYNCTDDFFANLTNVKPIECLSGPGYSVFASQSEDSVFTSNGTICVKIGSVKVPITSPSDIISSDLNDNIRLTWMDPTCGDCYQRGGQCGFKRESRLEVGCFNLPRTGLPKNVLVAIAMAFAAPLGLFATCIAYFTTRAFCYRRNSRDQGGVALNTMVMPQPHTIIGGLDRTTIESYPKVVLGESRRLPKPDDMNCPICLAEYEAKDTLRTLPHCGHCFHAECIDEWLHLNASCPVCRNAPPSPQDDNSL